MWRYYPQTETVNKDRTYYSSDTEFLKIDQNIGRGRKEATVLKSLKYYDNMHIQEYISSDIKDNSVHRLRTVRFSGNTLEVLLSDLTLLDKRIITEQLFSVLSFLLRIGVVHGDINISNVLWDGSIIHLIDWETAYFSDKTLVDLYGPPWGVLDVVKRVNQ